MRASRSVAEIDMFITMLRTACENPAVHEPLEKLLSMPDQRRQGAVHAWVSELLMAGAPQPFIAAIACLLDDAVAQKTRETIHTRCRQATA